MALRGFDPDQDDIDHRRRVKSRLRRRVLDALDGGLAILLFFILVIMTNYLSSRHYRRLDWTSNMAYSLCGKTTTLLESLQDSVTVTVFMQPDHDQYSVMQKDVVMLLSSYAEASRGRLTVEVVDPDRQPGYSEEIMRRHEVDRINVIIFESNSRRHIVKAEDLVDRTTRVIDFDGSPGSYLYRGEQLFTSALASMTEEAPARIYFLQGHGERDFEEHDMHTGLSSMAAMVRRDHAELIPFSFAESTFIPGDASALVIAAPTRMYSQSEVDRISTFVERAGRLILLLDGSTDAGFGHLLKRWGIKSVNSLVVDSTHTVSGYDVLVSAYADHPITKGLEEMISIFYWPRALPILAMEAAGQDFSDKPVATALALSSAVSWAEIEPGERPYEYDEGKDLRGPLPVAVASERGGATSLDMDISPARIVVFGDVDFISNSGISGANADLFLKSVNWVLDRTALLDISPRMMGDSQLVIDRKQLSRLYWIIVVVIPGSIVFAGSLVWWKRRR